MTNEQHFWQSRHAPPQPEGLVMGTHLHHHNSKGIPVCLVFTCFKAHFYVVHIILWFCSFNSRNMLVEVEVGLSTDQRLRDPWVVFSVILERKFSNIHVNNLIMQSTSSPLLFTIEACTFKRLTPDNQLQSIINSLLSLIPHHCTHHELNCGRQAHTDWATWKLSIETRLWAEWPGFNSQQGQWWDFFSSPPYPQWLWSPTSHLSNGYQGLLPWG